MVTGISSPAPPTGSTWEEPPPDSTPTSAWAPITAILRRFPFSGSTPSFFSSTVPASAAAWAILALAS
jgi:hypothetical protein